MICFRAREGVPFFFLVMVAVLFARKDSVYHTLPGVDVYDVNRDAFTFYGSCPVIAHPPCGIWGKYKKVCKEDKEYAYECAALAVKWVVRNGGIIEQPLGSGLFRAFGLKPNYRVFMSDFGYPAKKTTLLYSTVKLTLPALHLPAKCAFERLAKKHRDVTPVEMAKWLIDSLTLLEGSLSQNAECSD